MSGPNDHYAFAAAIYISQRLPRRGKANDRARIMVRLLLQTAIVRRGLTSWVSISKLIPNAKVLDNHLLIDPAAAVFERTAEEYQPLRQVLVSAVKLDHYTGCISILLSVPMTLSTLNSERT